MTMFKKEWPMPVSDTYASGTTPKARPVSNHTETYYKSVYDSNYDATKGVTMMPNKKVTTVDNKAKVQPKDLSKTKILDRANTPSFLQAMKEDKY